MIVLVSGIALCQSPTAPPEFEVAAIKANPSGDTSGETLGFPQDGRLVWRYVVLRDLIMLAYHVPAQYITGPSWLVSDSERFDLIAKEPPNTSSYDTRLMLRKLLADRFKLVVHEDQRVVSVFALVIGKRGASLAPAAEPDRPGTPCISRPAPDGLIHRECRNMTVSEFASALRSLAPSYIDRPVVDLTGIAGVYDFKLDWAPTTNARQGSNSAGNALAPDTEAGPTIFDAIEKRYGLRLEQQKHAMPIIAVDHVERIPTAN